MERQGAAPTPGQPVSRSMTNGHTLSRVTSPRGYDVFLDIETWAHIQERHVEIEDYEGINATIRDPSLIVTGKNDPMIRMYYRLIDGGQRRFRGLYQVVVVQLEAVGSGTEGIVKTSYIAKKPKGWEPIEWMKKQ